MANDWWNGIYMLIKLLLCSLRRECEWVFSLFFRSFVRFHYSLSTFFLFFALLLLFCFGPRLSPSGCVCRARTQIIIMDAIEAPAHNRRKTPNERRRQQPGKNSSPKLKRSIGVERGICADTPYVNVADTAPTTR